jgi:DNA-binding MarR family transcriptional regulator
MARQKPQAAVDPTLERDAVALYDALSELIRIYQFRDRDGIICYDVTVTQCYALEALIKSGPLTMNELSSRLYLDKSTVSRVVSSMEGKGLIRRRRHSNDGRAVSLHCTRKGRELNLRIRRDVEEREKRLLTEFDPEVRAAMIELIGRLAKAAESRVSTTGGCCVRMD